MTSNVAGDSLNTKPRAFLLAGDDTQRISGRQGTQRRQHKVLIDTEDIPFEDSSTTCEDKEIKSRKRPKCTFTKVRSAIIRAPKQLTHLQELSAGLRFMYENYTDRCWFWESLEMLRKLLITSSAVFVGEQARTSIVVVSSLSGIFAILHTAFKPIKDNVEYCLQFSCLLVIFFDLVIGSCLYIPADPSELRHEYEDDISTVTGLLILINSVFLLFVLSMLPCDSSN